MLDLVIIDGKARGIITRNLVTGEDRTRSAHTPWSSPPAVTATSSSCRPTRWARNGSAAWQCYKKGAILRQPLLHADPPDLYSGARRTQQSKLTLMSESLRNDGRIWVPKKKEDVEKLRAKLKKASEIAEEDRDYYLERRYPAFGNLVPRDVASRAAKERCDAGFGVERERGSAVFLDFSTAIERPRRTDVIQRTLRQPVPDVRKDHRRRILTRNR